MELLRAYSQLGTRVSPKKMLIVVPRWGFEFNVGTMRAQFHLLSQDPLWGVCIPLKLT